MTFVLLSLMFALPIQVTLVSAENADKQYVHDLAQLLKSDEIASLEEGAKSLSADISCDVVLLTTNDAQGKTSREMADDFYDYNGYGDDGMLLLIDMDNGEAYISTTGIAVSYYTEDRIDSTLDEIISYIQDDDFFGANECFLTQTQDYFSLDLPVEHSSSDLPVEITDEEYYLPQVSGDKTQTYYLSNFSLSTFLTFGIVSAIITVIIILLSVNKSYKMPTGNAHYPLEHYGKLNLIHSNDNLINRVVTTRKIPKHDPPSNSRSGRTHTSSSGRSHGGGGKKF